MAELNKTDILDNVSGEMNELIDRHLGLLIGLGDDCITKAESVVKFLIGQVVDAGPSSFFDSVNIKAIETEVDKNMAVRVLLDKMAGRAALMLTFNGMGVEKFIELVIKSVVSDHNPSSPQVSGIFPGMFMTNRDWYATREQLYLICLYLVSASFHTANWDQHFITIAPETKSN